MTPKPIPIHPLPVPAPAAAEPALVSMYEAQARIYPRAVTGWFNRWRWALVWLTQIVFYGLPWARWNGRPLMLFDLEARRFDVLGLVLHPQDFIYLTALLVISALALFFFTAVAGRLWCGYACPQTVYTEIFMWVEHRIEGDRLARMRLDKQPWNLHKIGRKGAKHAVWAAIGLYTGFSFVGYFVPIRTLALELATFSISPWSLFWVLFYGAATYGNAGFMREQICKYMCPYARFQSAMIDADSMIITYDSARGDPRGSRKRHTNARAQGLGDCVDCTLCVQVCPTGIDIRHGLQNECIGCAACIDVCNQVMDKMGSPHGLIRYATENGVAQQLSRGQMLRRTLRPRVLVYGAILLVVAGAFVASLALRSPFRVEVLKDRSTLARLVDEGAVENTYRLSISNGSHQPQRYRLAASGLTGLVLSPAGTLEVPAGQTQALTVHLTLPQAATTGLRGQSHPIRFDIQDAGGAQVHERSVFFVPR
ncbi:cytochrome c oxidase accessory protein CcoG [Aquabacterium sp. OR-4]|uniref:cytochrome c oxidase accessory protein CcoG n=1 Tax=Aquabacterium sp. OR-4 TaxID=2978127 RepID=UPI0021B2172C|nr:cytochrome c oxidase accessory protein CcoG [Aquabacterium sp. OR-4]MDT7835853.1 cytochrome c oxidase accessory protein CcoG [Aquabacterium sp. OR-4]